MIPVWRSLLFAAADDEGRLCKLHERVSDAIIVGLEDAVSSKHKPLARNLLPEMIDGLAGYGYGIVVRINSG